MKSLEIALSQHLRYEVTTIGVCWMIEKKNGAVILGTEHDEDIEISAAGSPINELAGIYRAGANIRSSSIKTGSDMSPDNMDVDGAIPPPLVDYIDVTVADIEAGLLNHAPVTVFACNWRHPDDGQLILRRGFLGEISRDSDGRYTTEVRGLLQLLAQQFMSTYGEKCSVKRLGDAQCKLDLTPITHTGTVTGVTNRKSFTTDLALSPYPDFRGAAFTFDTGANATFLREAKSGDFTFWEPWPNDVQIGDTFTVVEACDRTPTRCKALGNFVNFRGYGLFIPGIDALAKGPT